MSLKIDLYNALKHPEINNYNCLLFRLLFKADENNKVKLRSVYPEVIAMYGEWYKQGDKFFEKLK